MMETAKVRDVMTTKVLFEVAENDSLALAAHRMAWLGCRHLPVMRNDEVVGVLSERDVLAWRGGGRSLDGPDDRVSAAMSSPPIVATSDETLGEAAARMIAARIGCVPVVSHGRLVGMLTATDLLGQHVSETFTADGIAPGAPKAIPNADRLMTVFEAIGRRRAVRAYRPEAVDEATVRELLKEAVRAPTAMHAEPWSFVVIQDRALLKRLSDVAKNTFASEHAAAAVAHPPATSDARAAAILSEPDFNIFYDAGTLIVICARPLGSFVTADCWLAAENLMLAACAMGLGTCCIGFAVQMLNRPEVKAELGIPADVVAVAPIIVGRASAEAAATTRKAPEILSWRK
jgi:nitroreductase/CBS domain-containing protein